MASDVNASSQQSSKVDVMNAKLHEIFQLIESTEQKLKNQNKSENAILVLGESRIDRAIFTKWITDNDATLESKKHLIDSSRYVIVDTAQDNFNSTFDPVFPELMNNSIGTAFYNFPAFIRTSGMVHDIATTYFIKKVVHDVNKVKIIFLFDHASVMNDEFGRNLKRSMSTIMPVIENFDKYKGSVILVVSKVNYQLSYEQIIASLVSSINNTKTDLQKQMDAGNVNNARSIKFLDAIMHQNGTNYPYIKPFWSPNEEGPLSKISIMQSNKQMITKALEGLNYVLKNDNDFQYAMPKESLTNIGALIGELNQHLLAGIKNVGMQVQTFLYDKENQVYDLAKLYNETSFAYNELTKMKEIASQQNEALRCVQKIINNTFLPIDDIMNESLANASTYANYSTFLRNIGNYPIDETFKCADGLNDAIKYSDKSRKWYKFLIDLYNNMLSTYEVQRNTSESSCSDLAEFVITRYGQNHNELSDVLEPYVKKCDPLHEYDFKATIMDEPKFNMLYNVMNLTMNHWVESSCRLQMLFIRGQLVKLSEINEHEEKCLRPPKVINVFAIHKFLIDQDLEITGEVQLSVLAETWDVYGFRKIVLRGEQGKAHNISKAANGKIHDQAGEKGKPGLPGGPAGHFFGIGNNFINLPDLITSSIGGQGGPGQDGGDGAQGNDGVDAHNDLNMYELYPKKSPGHQVLSQKAINGICDESRPCVAEEIYILQGQEGSKGADGGYGGSGGKGGFPGTIRFFATSHSGDVQFKIHEKYGNAGSVGKGGESGKGGRYGRNGQVHIWNPTNINETTSLPKVEYVLLNNSIEGNWSGSSSYQGINSEEIQDPRKSEPFTNETKTYIVRNYIAYLKKYMYHSIRESKLKEFLDRFPYKSGKVNITRTSPKPTPNSNSTNSPEPTPAPTSTPPPMTNLAPNHNSPINTVLHSIGDFFIPHKFIYPTLVANYKLIKNSIQSMFENSMSSPSNAFYTTTKLDEFNVNGAIAMADFLIRCITKMKPYNNIEKFIDVCIIRAVTLDIIAEFQIVLSHLIDESNLPNQLLDFDPVGLTSKLDKKLNNQDYKDLVKVLFQSVNDSAHLDYASFLNVMQPKIEQILMRHGEENLFN